MNAANAISVLSQRLSEERAMADWIKTNTPDMVAQLGLKLRHLLLLYKENNNNTCRRRVRSYSANVIRNCR
jgi:hypothetical protein